MSWIAYLWFCATTGLILRRFNCKAVTCPTNICKCSESKQSAICSGHGKNLSHIPQLAIFVRSAHFNRDYFPVISEELFNTITSNNILDISFRGSDVQNITPTAFHCLSHLTSLDLSSNKKINVTSLKQSLSSLGNKNPLTFLFEQMEWKSLRKKLFSGVRGIVRSLSLNGNFLQHLPSGVFDGVEKVTALYIRNNKLEVCDKALLQLTYLRKLDLSHNVIKTCDWTFLPNSLESLHLSNNSITNIPMLCFNNSNFPNLVSVMLDKNNIHSISKSSFSCLSALKYINMASNDISIFPPEAFSSLLRLDTLILHDMKRRVRIIGRNAFAIPSLKEFIFFGNRFRFMSMTLRKCSKLKRLDLSYNFMPKKTLKARYLLGGLTELKDLFLSGVSWKLIPDNFFKLVPNVSRVHLSSNGIIKLNSSIFSEQSKITELLLDHNSITHIAEDTFNAAFWQTIKILDLSVNPFTCDCDLLWFKTKMATSSSKFRYYPERYICLSPPDKKDLHLSNFTLKPEDCETKSELVTVLISSGSICLFVMISILIVYKGRWHIRYWTYLLRYRRSEYRRLGDVEFKYDAFVIYSDEDSDFVHNTLMPKLEDDEQFRLCVHFRDFQPGKIIADNIVESMNNSRMAIVVLSKYFCDSRWCKFELIIAQDRWLNNESDALLIVMLEDLESDHMTKDLRALIRTTTYVMWTEDNLGQRLFWDQIRNTLSK